jgi:hypothetical protein
MGATERRPRLDMARHRGDSRSDDRSLTIEGRYADRRASRRSRNNSRILYLLLLLKRTALSHFESYTFSSLVARNQSSHRPSDRAKGSVGGPSPTRKESPIQSLASRQTRCCAATNVVWSALGDSGICASITTGVHMRASVVARHGRVSKRLPGMNNLFDIHI